MRLILLPSTAVSLCRAACLVLLLPAVAAAEAEQVDEREAGRLIARPELYEPLTEPPCSYCSTEHRKRLIEEDDRVVAWLRAAHNGGAIPLRHFLAGPRVINDTYGLFFYDPDGGYVAAYPKDYGYRFHGWRNGVMVVQGPDGTLWSALSGLAFEGPKTGERLPRIPSLVTDWGHWLMLHPESTAYDLFDGKTYPPVPLPATTHPDARASMGPTDPRLKPGAPVLGVDMDAEPRAFPLNRSLERACYLDTAAGVPIAVFWYGPTGTAVAFRRELEGRTLTFYADAVAPDAAPFMDRETRSRWTLAGRAVDGPLKGKELEWVPSIQCRWHAWSAEYPETEVFDVGEPRRSAPARRLRGVLLSPAQATAERLARARREGHNAAVLSLDDASAERAAAQSEAAARIRAAGLDLYYWIEIARHPRLADAHPAWMSSLQGHHEWRRLFPDAPQPGPDEVVKAWPWVPILYQEAFTAHLERVETLLVRLPAAKGILLNDLQGGPSACGCGNSLCRWTTDYGPIRTATPLESDAAARFTAAVARIAPETEIIPVWTSECDEHDGAEDGLCAGVGCFEGICWRAWTEQLMPLAAEANRIGVLLPYRLFQQDRPGVLEEAEWVDRALRSFEAMPPQRGGEAVATGRLLAVLQGWNVTPEEIGRQIERAREAGAGGWIVSELEIAQDWEPRLVRWRRP